MRRMKLKFIPSLEEESNIEGQLEDALNEEKNKEAQTNTELSTASDNNGNPEAASAAPADTSDGTVPAQPTDESTAAAVSTPAESTDSTSDDNFGEVESWDNTVVADEPVGAVDSWNGIGQSGDVTDVIAEEVVRQSSGEDNAGVKAFSSKIMNSYTLAQSKGFEGNFDEFLKTLVERIDAKESEAVQNPLGTDANADTVAPNETTATQEVSDTVKTADAAIDDSSNPDLTQTETDSAVPPTEATDTANTTDATDTGVDTTSAPEQAPDISADADTTQNTDTNLNGEQTDDTQPTDTVKADEAPAPAAGDDESLNEYIDEVDEDQEDVDSNDAMVSEAEDSSSRLGRIAEIVQDAIQTAKTEGDGGDVNESLTKIAEIANECYARHYGIDRKYSVFVSNESLLESITPIQRAEVALEGIKETLKGIIEAILKAIDAAFQWFGDLFRKIQLNTGLLERKVTSLEKTVNALEGAPKQEFLTSPRLIKNLSVDGMVKNQVFELDRVNKVADTVYGSVNKWVIETYETVMKMVRQAELEQYGMGKFAKGTSNLEITKTTMPSFSGLRLTTVANPATAGVTIRESQDDPSLAYALSDRLPGDMAILVCIPNQNSASSIASSEDKHPLSGVAKVWSNKSIGAKLVELDTTASGKQETQIPSLSIDEMKNVLSATKSLITQVKKYNKASKDITEARKKIRSFATNLKIYNSLNKMSSTGADESSQARMNANSLAIIAGIFSAANRSISEPATKFTMYCLKLIASELSYISQSIQSFSEKAATDGENASGVSSNQSALLTA